MIYNDCRDCSKYTGNCGNHFRDSEDHINYNISAESYMDGVIGPYASCFEPSDSYIESLKTEKIKKIIEQYTVKDLEQALEVIRLNPKEPTNKKYISANFETIGKCPKCGVQVVDSIGGTQKECKKCGQPLLWR